MDTQHKSGKVYIKHGIDFELMGYSKKAIEYLKNHMTTAIENGDRDRDGAAYADLGNAYELLGDYRKGREYHDKNFKIAIEIGDRGGKGRAYEKVSVMLTSSSVTIKKP